MEFNNPELNMDILDKTISKCADELNDKFLAAANEISSKLATNELFKDESAALRVTIIGSTIGMANIISFANFISNITKDPETASKAFRSHAEQMKILFEQVIKDMEANNNTTVVEA